MLAPRSLAALSLVSTVVTGAYVDTSISGYVPTWKDWACPPPSTEYLAVTATENYTYTTAVTETVTLYQTVIDTVNIVRVEQYTSYLWYCTDKPSRRHPLQKSYQRPSSRLTLQPSPKQLHSQRR